MASEVADVVVGPATGAMIGGVHDSANGSVATLTRAAERSRPEASRPQGSRPEASRPQGSRPQASRPQGSRPDASVEFGSRTQAHVRIVDAALSCISRWGLAKTTLDDVAREAGVGRATLYRLFPGGREALFEAVVQTEIARFLSRLDEHLADAASLEDVFVISISEAGQCLAGHTALQFLLAHEPETILPSLAFQQMDAILGIVGSTFGPYIARYLRADVDPEAAPRAAEWVARIVLSYLVAPSADVNFEDRGSVRRLVRTFILPGLTAANNTN